MTPQNDLRDYYISQGKTPADWIATRTKLETDGKPELWKATVQDFFLNRIELRYLLPISVLQSNDTLQGEGFSMMAIICSLIEFLESTYQGKVYRYVQDHNQLLPTEYSHSKRMFVSFLENRDPFKSVFNNTTATEFYVSIRCGLLHEAQIKDGWRIQANSQTGIFVDLAQKVVFRNDFIRAVKEFLKTYVTELETNGDLQRAFIVKFNSL